MLFDNDVKLYSFLFNRPYIDDCIKIVYKKFLIKKFYSKHELQINNNNSFIISILNSSRYFLIVKGKKYGFG